MRKSVLIIIILMLIIQQAQAEWDKVIDKIRDKIVLIEYYEQIITSEAIVERERVKKRLTGVLVDDDGLIMTAADIFPANLEFSPSANFFDQPSKPTEIRVKFEGKELEPAEFIGKDDDKKIAFIKLLKKPGVTPIRFLANAKLRLGSKILILQHLPRQYDYELIISERLINSILSKAPEKYLCENSLKSLSDFGLVLNPKGQAIGILDAPDDLSGNAFNLPEMENQPAEVVLYNTFARLISDPPLFREKETTRKKWLGIYMQSFNREMAHYFHVPDMSGVLVNTVLEDSPAAQAELQAGDIILAVNDQKIRAEKDSDLERFRDLIREQEDSNVWLRIFRNGQYFDKLVVLGDTPISQFLADEISNPLIGLSVKELTQDIILAKQLDWDAEGVWVSKVESAGWADVAGLQIGDLILKINERKVSGLEDFREIFKNLEGEKPEYLSLFIRRRTDTQFLFIKTNFQQH